MVVMPLFQGLQGDKLVGTGLLIKPYERKISGLQAGFIYDLSETLSVTESEIAESLGGNEASSLVGFAVEESTISEIRFEIWDANACEEGMLVWCKIGDSRVYYQIIGGVNKEESFEANRQGFQIAIATQLGIFDEKLGFLKYNWLPRMNTPIFSERNDFGADIKMVQDGDFKYGNLPGTKILVGGPFCKFIDHHTAILGVTGSGKTELAFDLIRDAVSQGVKVICIDLTSRYEGKLQDLSPKSLSLKGTLAKEIGDKLFAIETGEYGGYAQKKDFQTFVEPLRKDIPQRVKSFLTSTDKDQQVGIIALEEISNTKATLWITELYLTCILHFAKNNPTICPKILLVVEEAHTVMPEPRSMGLGDFDSQGLVSKISQIALQGRKYGVGLLVIAQRTATVSKSILTQCNTVISFNCFDDTSLKFLSNIFGSTYVSLIPNLPFLHAIIFGKGIRSQRPLIIKIPHSDIKANSPS